jgi:hypothetical protein
MLIPSKMSYALIGPRPTTSYAVQVAADRSDVTTKITHRGRISAGIVGRISGRISGRMNGYISGRSGGHISGHICGHFSGHIGGHIGGHIVGALQNGATASTSFCDPIAPIPPRADQESGKRGLAAYALGSTSGFRQYVRSITTIKSVNKFGHDRID